MININNVAIFIRFFTDSKSLLNFAHLLLKMHPTTDQNMGNIPMLIKNFDEQTLVLLNFERYKIGIQQLILQTELVYVPTYFEKKNRWMDFCL